MGKSLVILACVCAVAYAQFGNQLQSSFGQNSAFGNSRSPQQNVRLQQQSTRQQSAFGSQNQYKQPQNQYQQNQNQYQQNQNQYQQNQNQYQQNQNQYQQNQNQYQQQSAPKQSAGACRENNERYPVSGSCDRYIECINGTSEEKLCPDGLLFDPNTNINRYPCLYPNEVACLERSSLQPAQPTDECPHQFGYYKIGDARNCSGFRSCVNGVAHDFTCPEGLAWSSESYRCEWPDSVADCDAEAFLGFRCPEVPVSRELGPPAGFRFYRSDTDCQRYFICIDGRPRALSCGGDAAFDELSSTCVLADEVDSCPPELRAVAARSREAEQQRIAKQLEIDSLPRQNIKRQF